MTTCGPKGSRVYTHQLQEDDVDGRVVVPDLYTNNNITKTSYLVPVWGCGPVLVVVVT